MKTLNQKDELFHNNEKVGEIVYQHPFYKIMINGKMYERTFSRTKARKIARILLNDFAFIERALAA